MEAKTDKQRKVDKAAAPRMTAYDKLVAGLVNRAGQVKNRTLETKASKYKQKIALKEKEKSRVQKIKDFSHKDKDKQGHVKKGLSEKRNRKRLRLEE